jgi:hypothetical protein
LPDLTKANRALGHPKHSNYSASGWRFLLILAPFGAIVVIVFLAQDSNHEAKNFGEDPKKSAA